MRGAWLSAFACHTLGMAVELRFHDSVIWESAGSNGIAIFEIGKYPVPNGLAIPNSGFNIAGSQDQVVDSALLHCYPIGEVFASLITRWGRLDALLEQAIRRAICRISLWSRESDVLYPYMSPNKECRNFRPTLEAFKETSNAFGFENSLIDSVSSQLFHTDPHPRFPHGMDGGLIALDFEAQVILFKACGQHGDDPSRATNFCICEYVKQMIVGFAYSINLLSYCRFNPNQLYIYEESVLGLNSKPSLPEMANRKVLMDIIHLVDANSESLSFLHPTDLYDYPDTSFERYLGISGRSFTVCYSCILSHDCYDDQNRFLSLLPGRASIAGTFRPIITSDKIRSPLYSYDLSGPATALLAPGFTLAPHYVPSGLKASIQISLEEKKIVVAVQVDAPRSRSITVSLGKCLEVVMSGLMFYCQHDPKSEYRVIENQNLVVSGFCQHTNGLQEDQDATRIFALHGNKLEQILVVGLNCSSSGEYSDVFLFQHFICLGCSIQAAQTRTGGRKRYIIMAG
ncbi:hypothetical protein F5Y11DRAFT_332385 [Daldinia sp. FL1419]|nr:hypothetical protein F5Y11DRAFT_332385 [Daldinia sp. FL1419]